MAVLVKSQYFAKKSHVVVVSTCGQGDTHLKLQLLKRYGELTSVQLNFTEFASEIVLIAVKSYFGEIKSHIFLSGIMICINLSIIVLSSPLKIISS